VAVSFLQIFFLFFFLSHSSLAEDFTNNTMLPFEPFEITRSGRIPFNAKQTSEPIWITTSGGGKALSWKLRFTSPLFKKFKKATAKSADANAVLVGEVLDLSTTRILENVTLTGNGSPLTLELIYNPFFEPNIVGETCAQEKIFLTRQSTSLEKAFAVGAFCERKGENVFFTLSFPPDVEMLNSSLYEIEGKGEPWRTYKIGILGAEKTKIASFLFGYQNRNTSYQLDYLPEEPANHENVTRPPLASVGLGYGHFEMLGAKSTTSDSRIVFSANVPFYKLGTRFGTGGRLDWSLYLTKKEANISYSQIELYALSEVGITDSINLRPKIGFANLNFENGATGAGLSGAPLALGSQAEIKWDKSWVFYLDLMTLKTISKSLNSHWAIDFTGLKTTESSLSYGGGIRYQTFQGPTAENDLLDFSQLVFQALILF